MFSFHGYKSCKKGYYMMGRNTYRLNFLLLSFGKAEAFENDQHSFDPR